MGFRFDYFYGMETRQYKYFVIPQVLILDELFRSLSDRAKILYCIMLDRSSLSAKNGWIDEQGKVFIIMTRDEIMEKIGCSHTTAHKFMQELIDFGLIKKRRRGQGNPDWIYVMNFDKLEESEDAQEEIALPEVQKSCPLEVQAAHEGFRPVSKGDREDLPLRDKKSCPLEVQKPFPLEGKKSCPLEVQKPFPLEGKESFPESDLYNKTDININQSSSSLSGDDEEYIKQHLGYEEACQKYSEIIVDLLYQELVKRDPAVWERVTQKVFLALCNNVTSYHGGVANVRAYIARCIDNMLIAAAANIANHSPPASKNKNPFNDFPQNRYDFAALEEELLANR